MTENASTYDFKFEKRQDVADFIVAVSQAVRPTKENFVGVTNHSLVRMILFKTKLAKIAKAEKMEMRGLLMRGIYRSASQLLPEDTLHLKCIKYQDLEELSRKCFLMSVQLTNDDREVHERLKAYIENMLNIDLDNCEHFQKVIADEDDSFAT